jgi:hypothetical protein
VKYIHFHQSILFSWKYVLFQGLYFFICKPFRVIRYCLFGHQVIIRNPILFELFNSKLLEIFGNRFYNLWIKLWHYAFNVLDYKIHDNFIWTFLWIITRRRIVLFCWYKWAWLNNKKCRFFIDNLRFLYMVQDISAALINVFSYLIRWPTKK